MTKQRNQTIKKVESAFTSQILKLMEQRHMNRVELSRRLGVVPAYVTRLLSGTANITMETMIKMADALNASVEIKLCPHPQPHH